MWPKKLRPEKFIGSYNISRKSTLQRKYGPELLNNDIFLNKCRQKLLRVEEELDHRRERHKAESAELLQKWDEIGREGLEMQKSFLDFNKFLITNVQKRKRAADALAHNRLMVRQHDDGVAELTANIATVHGMMGDIEGEVQRHRMYEKYLHHVLDASDREDQMRNVDSIVERFEYFTEIAVDLMQKQEAAFDVLQNVRADWSKSEEINGNIIIGLHTQLAGLQGRFDVVTERTHHLENLIKKIKESTANNYKDVQITRDSILNLYHIICRSRNAPPKLPKADVENQLVFIGKSLKEYRYVNEQLTAQNQKKKRVEPKIKR